MALRILTGFDALADHNRSQDSPVGLAGVEQDADAIVSEVAKAKSHSLDALDQIEVHRIDRAQWSDAPARPGVYLLYGFVNDSPAAYVGMSTTSILGRIQSHHVNASKDWFGTLFAIPVDHPVLCPPIEAELIRRIREAGVVDFVDNKVQPQAFLDTDDVHVGPALENIIDALGVLLGTDIFTPQSEEEHVPAVTIVKKFTPLSRVYQGNAAQPRARTENDPPKATHAWIGSQLEAWGSFEGPEPEIRFRVFAGSQFRRVTVNSENTTYAIQVKVDETQRELEAQGVLDFEKLVFLKDNVFENWTRATYVVSGKPTYSGGYHWQQIK